MIKDRPTGMYDMLQVTRKTIFLIRGHPGSGKTSIGHIIAPGACYAADDWFEAEARRKDSTYGEVWTPQMLDVAHQWCFDQVEIAVNMRCNRVAVTNTFQTLKQIEPYRELAEKNRYTLFVLRCENDFENIHDVPKHQVEKMKANMQDA